MGEVTGVGRRSVVAGGALASVGAALGVGVPAGTARAAAPGAAGEGTATLRTEALEVTVDAAFPRIVDYTDRETGARIHAQSTAVRTLLVDGEEQTPKVTAGAATGKRIAYTLTLKRGTEVGVEIVAEGRQVHWRVTRIEERPGGEVGTLQVPGLAFLTVRSDQPDAVLYAARVELDKDKSGDTLVEVTEAAQKDDKPAGCAYAVVSTRELAAAIETNTVYDKPGDTPGADWDNGRLWRQTTQEEGRTVARLTCGQWTYRAATAPKDRTEPLPYVTVILTGDRNGDGVVDWQDAAIAMRDIMVDPPGADEQHLRVVPHIPFNFASLATNPFLTTLDHVKRIHRATDGLRQFTLLKGYQSEGHDSAHPDYAGNWNERAGGLDDLNTLLARGKKWNADFAVHINATESYPVADAFSDKLVDKENEQWDWLDQSYRIDQRRDLVTGGIEKRLADLRAHTDDGLNSLYIDVFRESGWTSDALQRIFRDQGWHIATEWGHGFERSALWSHWATETDYGGDTSRGINSRLIRFIRNHQKDVFADKWPTLLGVPRMGNYEGWTGKTDWHTFYELIWTHSLPAKYLQARPIRTWREHEITFEPAAGGKGATSVTDEDGKRRITTDGRLVYDDGAYLLPWEPRRATDPDRLYHYNPRGGRTTWRLPAGWSGARTVRLYPLTDAGRGEPVAVRVSGGKVTLDAEAGRPYVVHRRPAPAAPDPHWGEGTPLTDPGFHSGSLDAWQVTGSARVERNELGDPELVLPGGGAASVGQRLARLAPGDYAASVQVEVGDKAGERRRASLTVRTPDGVTAENFTHTSTAVNQAGSDLKHGTRFQRMTCWFTVPPGGGPSTLTLAAEAGAATVRFDHVRVVAAPKPAARDEKTLCHEDFEHVPQGWGPFVKGDAGGANDPRTHIAQRHAPYTQRGWNGKAVDDVVDGMQSLKSRGENTGLVYRTVPHTVRFAPGKKYRVSFRYENEKAGQYAWVTGVDTPGAKELDRTPLPVATAPSRHTYTFTAPDDGEAWVGLRKTGDDAKAECVLDTFTVTELDQ